jgi:hypothetical protein
MKKLFFLFAIFCFVLSCEKSPENKTARHIARIVGFDPNCATCIMEFPDYSSLETGDSLLNPGILYEAVNLNKGSFRVGQLLKVAVRKAKDNEARQCITLYPSGNYQGVFITDYEEFNNLEYVKTISLPDKECLFIPENGMYICLDSVLNDSRCPIGAECFWAGNAEIRLRYFESNTEPVYFNLNTLLQPSSYTSFDGYKFTLIDLSPYPATGHSIEQKDYKAKILIEKN